MRLLPIAVLALLSTAALPADATAQRHSEPGKSATSHTRDRRPTAKLMRWEVTAGTGMTAGVLTGVPQAAPTLQLNAGYAVSPRLIVGLAYSQASFSPRPYVDGRGVVSREVTQSRHFGLRAKGVILRRGITSVYGGIQLGVTTSDASYVHDFPADLQIEDEAAYLYDRPSPFYDPGDQVGAIGFLGVSARVLRHVEVYTELGNNLALVNAGAAFVF